MSALIYCDRIDKATVTYYSGFKRRFGTNFVIHFKHSGFTANEPTLLLLGLERRILQPIHQSYHMSYVIDAFAKNSLKHNIYMLTQQCWSY